MKDHLVPVNTAQGGTQRADPFSDLLSEGTRHCMTFLSHGESYKFSDALLLSYNLIKSSIQQTGYIPPRIQTILFNCQTTNVGGVVNLDRLIYCECVISVFHQFLAQAKRHELSARAMGAKEKRSDVKVIFQPLLSLVLFVVCHIGDSTPLETYRTGFANATERYESEISPHPTENLVIDPYASVATGLAPESFFDNQLRVPWNKLIAVFTGTGDSTGSDNYRTKAFSLNGIDPTSGVLVLKEVIVVVNKVRKMINWGGKSKIKFADVTAFTQGVIRDHQSLAEPGAMAAGFGDNFTDNLERYCAKGYLDRVFQLPSPSEAEPRPDVVAGGRPEVSKYCYSPNGPGNSEGRFHLVTVKNPLSPEFHRMVWEAIDTHEVLHGIGTRKGSFIFVATRSPVKEPQSFFAIGTGATGKAVKLYPTSTMGTALDVALFRLANCLMEIIWESVQEQVDRLSEGSPKHVERFEIDLFAAVLAPGNHVGFGAHSDFSPTIARCSEDGSEGGVGLPSRDGLVIPTLVMHHPDKVDLPELLTTYVYQDENGNVIRPELDRDDDHDKKPKYIPGPKVTGNFLTIQGPQSQRCLHTVKFQNARKRSDAEHARVGLTFRVHAVSYAEDGTQLPGTYHRAPNILHRLTYWRKWMRERGINNDLQFERVQAPYVHHADGNFVALTSPDPDRKTFVPAVSSRGYAASTQKIALELPPEETEANGSSEDSGIGEEAEGVVFTEHDRDDALRIWREVAVDTLPNAPAPFDEAPDIERQNATVASKFPESHAMLHRSVVRNVLFGADAIVKFKDGEGTLPKSQLYMPNGLFAEPLKFYERGPVCAAGGVIDNAGARAHPLFMPNREDVQDIWFITQEYKSVYSTILDLIWHLCEAKRADWNPSQMPDEHKENPVLVTMGSGGSNIAAGAQNPKIKALAIHIHNTGDVLQITDGQDIFHPSRRGRRKTNEPTQEAETDGGPTQNAEEDCEDDQYKGRVNHEVIRSVRNGRPHALFLDALKFLRKSDRQELTERHGDIFGNALMDEDGGQAETAKLLFLGYRYVNKVEIVSSSGEPGDRDLSHLMPIDGLAARADATGNNDDGEEDRSDESDGGDDGVGGAGEERRSVDECDLSRLPVWQSDEEILEFSGKLLGGCRVAHGSEEVHQQHGTNADFLNNCHLRAHIVSVFTTEEQGQMLRRQRFELEKYGKLTFREVVVDKQCSEPFTTVLSKGLGRKAVGGSQVYTLLDMREELSRKGFTKYLVGDSDAMVGDSEEEAQDNGEDGDEQTGFDMANLAKMGGEATVQIGRSDLIKDLLFINLSNSMAGYERMLGASVVREVGEDGLVADLTAAGPLDDQFLLHISRMIPTPMSHRSLDHIPVLVMASAYRSGLLQLNESSYGRPITTYVRHIHRSGCGKPEYDRVCTLHANAALFRVTGHCNFLHGFYKWWGTVLEARNQFADRESTHSSDVAGFGYRNSNCGEEREGMRYFLTTVCPVVKGRRKLPKIFSSQHRGQIPTSLQNTESFISFASVGAPSIAVEFLRLIDDMMGDAVPLRKPGQSHTTDNEKGCDFDSNNKRITKETARLMAEAVVGSSPGDEARWMFLSSCLIKDLQTAVCFSCLEPLYLLSDDGDVNLVGHYKVQGGSWSDWNICDARCWKFPMCAEEEDGIFEGEEPFIIDDSHPNVAQYPVGSVPCAAGSKQYLDYARAATGNPNLSLADLFKSWIEDMTNLRHYELHALGFDRVRVTNHRVVIDKVTGVVVCVKYFEHKCCKVYVVLKYKFQQYSNSRVYNSDKAHCQPIVIGGTKKCPALFDYPANIPGLLESVRSFALALRGRNGEVLASSMYQTEPPDIEEESDIPNVRVPSLATLRGESTVKRPPRCCDDLADAEQHPTGNGKFIVCYAWSFTTPTADSGENLLVVKKVWKNHDEPPPPNCVPWCDRNDGKSSNAKRKRKRKEGLRRKDVKRRLLSSSSERSSLEAGQDATTGNRKGPRPKAPTKVREGSTEPMFEEGEGSTKPMFEEGERVFVSADWWEDANNPDGEAVILRRYEDADANVVYNVRYTRTNVVKTEIPEEFIEKDEGSTNSEGSTNGAPPRAFDYYLLENGRDDGLPLGDADIEVLRHRFDALSSQDKAVYEAQLARHEARRRRTNERFYGKTSDSGGSSSMRSADDDSHDEASHGGDRPTSLGVPTAFDYYVAGVIGDESPAIEVLRDQFDELPPWDRARYEAKARRKAAENQQW